ncbi:MAG: PDZ domain-containing protein [Acidobacteriota bacterium]
MIKKFFLINIILSTAAMAFAQEKSAPATTQTENGQVVIQFQQNTTQPIKPWVVYVVHKIDVNKLLQRYRGNNNKVAVPDSMPQYSYNITTGAVIDETGHIVTRLVNLDPLDKEQNITIITGEGTSLPATFIGLDSPSGFAVLQAPSLKIAPSTAPAEIKQGKLVKILSTDVTQPLPTSNPQAPIALSPLIKSLNGEIDTTSPYTKVRGIMTVRSAKLFSRNDSAVVTSVDDQLVGLAQYAGVGRAYLFPIELIRSTIAKRVIDKKDSVPSGWLGVKGVSPFQLSSQEKAALGAEVKAGVVVKEVTAGSPAASGGILPDDVIVGFNDFNVISTGDLSQLLASSPSGSRVKLRMFRQQKPLELNVELGARPLSEQSFELMLWEPTVQAKSEAAQIDELLRRREELGAQLRSYSASPNSQEKTEALRELQLEFNQLFDRLRALGYTGNQISNVPDPSNVKNMQAAQTCSFNAGFTARVLTPQLAASWGIPSPMARTLYVIEVVKGSSADTAGLKTPDILLGTSKKVVTCAELKSQFASPQGNKTLKVFRKQQSLSITIKGQ